MRNIAPLILLLFCIYFFSCKKENNSPGQQESSLTADKEKIELSNNISNKDSFVVQFNGNWSLSINPSPVAWLKTSVVSGTGNTKVYVTVQEKNTSTAARTATIVVKSQSNAAKSVTISITQDREKQWQPMAAFPGVGRAAASGFVLGDNFFVGLGWGHKDNSDQDLADTCRKLKSKELMMWYA
jgi:hypothetical protein